MRRLFAVVLSASLSAASVPMNAFAQFRARASAEPSIAVPTGTASPPGTIGLIPDSRVVVLPLSPFLVVPRANVADVLAQADVRLSAAAAPERPAEAVKAEADNIFDSSAAKEEPSFVSAAPASVEPARLSAPHLDRRIEAMGPVPAPRPWLEKSKVLIGYAALTATSVVMHAPFARIAPIVMAAVLSPIATMMFYAYDRSAVSGVLAAGESAAVDAQTAALIARLAREARVPAPARVKVLRGGWVEARVGNRDEAGYEILFTAAFSVLRPEAREAILRHEFAHIRHHDLSWRKVKTFLAPLPMLIALCGADGTALVGALSAAITAASILLFLASLRASEYLADQYAASKAEGAGPLARFFNEFVEDSRKTLLSAHPSHDERGARLARLAEKKRR